MSIKLLLAIITITLALVFYTIGVFWERRTGQLTWKHLSMFALGFVFDTTGTTIMTQIAKSATATATLPLHRVTGVMAILLMAFHLLWAIFVLIKGNPRAKLNFHCFSLLVWSFWLIPYLAGMFMGMGA